MVLARPGAVPAGSSGVSPTTWLQVLRLVGATSSLSDLVACVDAEHRRRPATPEPQARGRNSPVGFVQSCSTVPSPGVARDAGRRTDSVHSVGRVSNDSPQLSERTYVTARIYPPGVRPGTPAGKKFMQSIAIDRYAADQVSRAPRMSREVREKVFTLLGSSPREMPPPKPEIRERPAYRLPERTTVDFETDEMLTPGRVGRRLGVSESVARLMIRRGVLGSVVVGQPRFVPMSEADRWKATGEAPPPEPTLRKARVASEQREKDRQSAITRARTELSAMQSGTWVRPRNLST